MNSRKFVWLVGLLVLCGVGYYFYSSVDASRLWREKSFSSNDSVATPQPGAPVLPPQRATSSVPKRPVVKDVRGLGPLLEESDPVKLSERVLEARKEMQGSLGALRDKHDKPIRFEQNSTRYEVLSNVMALPQKGFLESPDFKIVQRANGFVFLKKTGEKEFPEKALPVVLSSEQRLGVITGNVLIRYSEQNRASEFASEFQLQVVKEFNHLNLAYFKTGRETASDLVGLVTTLKSDQRVTETKLEIADKAYVPK